jgi:hypothetical protein
MILIILEYSQMWLNLFVDDPKCGKVTKIEKKTKEKKRNQLTTVEKVLYKVMFSNFSSRCIGKDAKHYIY